MTSSRPYLVRALYEWIVDNTFTPYLLVNTASAEVLVPRAFIENGRIILNISPDATHSLILGNDSITFNARFSGAAMDVVVPVTNVLAIYAKENGQGMMFENQDDSPSDPTTPTSIGERSTPPIEIRAKKPTLKIVK